MHSKLLKVCAKQKRRLFNRIIKISVKQPAGFWSKPLECFRGHSIRYWSNNEPFLPGRTKIEEIQQQSKLKKCQFVEFKTNH